MWQRSTIRFLIRIWHGSWDCKRGIPMQKTMLKCFFYYLSSSSSYFSIKLTDLSNSFDVIQVYMLMRDDQLSMSLLLQNIYSLTIIWQWFSSFSSTWAWYLHDAAFTVVDVLVILDFQLSTCRIENKKKKKEKNLGHGNGLGPNSTGRVALDLIKSRNAWCLSTVS